MGDTIGRASAFVCLPKRPPTLLFPIPLTCITALTLAGGWSGEGEAPCKAIFAAIDYEGSEGMRISFDESNFFSARTLSDPAGGLDENVVENIGALLTPSRQQVSLVGTLDNARANFQHGSTCGGQNAVSEQR